MRNVASSEGVSGNVRTTELATQAADIALRHCEASVVRQMDGAAPTAVDPAFGLAGSEAWKTLGNWDGSTPTFFRVDAPLMTGTYVRNPECMVEFLAGGIASRPASFLVTARGFGPEVRTAAGAGRPDGTVVWLQSTLDFQ